MEWKRYLRVASVLVLLYVLYLGGFPAIYLPLAGILFLALVLLRGRLYKRIDEELAKRLPFVEKLPSWGKKLLILLVLIATYFLVKQLVFTFLKAAGVDVQQMLLESINKSSQA